MILLIDNYDSFTYNLVQYLGELGANVVTKRNDSINVYEALAMKPKAIMLSPGPSTPSNAGISMQFKAVSYILPSLILVTLLIVFTKGTSVSSTKVLFASR